MPNTSGTSRPAKATSKASTSSIPVALTRIAKKAPRMVIGTIITRVVASSLSDPSSRIPEPSARTVSPCDPSSRTPSTFRASAAEVPRIAPSPVDSDAATIPASTSTASHGGTASCKRTYSTACSPASTPIDERIDPEDSATMENGTPMITVPAEPAKQAFRAVSGLSAAKTRSMKSMATMSPRPSAAMVARLM